MSAKRFAMRKISEVLRLRLRLEGGIVVVN